MEETTIDVPQPPPSAVSCIFTESNLKTTGKVHGRLDSPGRERRRDTWVISVFVIAHLIAFFATMFVNNCPANSAGERCAAPGLGMFSFQPVLENPLLGPSFSTFDKMGGLRRTLLEQHQVWRLFSSPWLHGGLIHLILDVVGTVYIGIYLEQEFGPVRIGAIYLLSALSGTFVAALFVCNTPVVTSSGALLGLLGAKLSAILRNWELFTHKASALLILSVLCVCNFSLGLLPYVDNYANVGGFISGMLLGFTLFFSPQITSLHVHGVRKDGAKRSVDWKLKLDKPVLRSVSLVLFLVLLVGTLVAAILQVNISKQCGWCAYFDCIPSKRWSCHDITASCESMISSSGLTLTCISNGNFRLFPMTNISSTRTTELCTLICS